MNALKDIPGVSVEFHPAVKEDKTINLQEDVYKQNEPDSEKIPNAFACCFHIQRI